MKSSSSIASLTTLALSSSIIVESFTFVPTSRNACLQQSHELQRSQHEKHTMLKMGLFDEMKEAFSAPALERSSLDSERETPIDRWMGWNAKEDESEAPGTAVPANFIDSMDEGNYITAKLKKPMGIVFEENDEEYGGIFVLSVTEGGVASTDGRVKSDDQLISVDGKKVSGMPFDDALAAIVDGGDDVELVLFRGSAKQFYGPTGPSSEWLDEFVSKRGNNDAGEEEAPAPAASEEA